MGYFKINENVHFGANTTIRKLKNIANRPYATYRFTAFTLNSSTTTRTESLTINRTGRPVYLICTGDWNAGSGTGDWLYIILLKNGTELKRICIQGTNTSQNSPFAATYLDTTTDTGSTTYTVTFSRGGGSGTCGENGDLQAPIFSVFEI